jgi:hypothetical protein
MKNVTTSPSATTSCPFAQNVRDAYFSVPGDSVEVEVHSPVTGKDYVMACVKSGDTGAMAYHGCGSTSTRRGRRAIDVEFMPA